MRTEDNLAFLLSHPELKEEAIGDIKARLKYNLDWNYIFKIATRHQTACLIYHSLKKNNLLGCLPPYIEESFRNSYYANVKRNAFILAEAKEILKDFSACKIKAVVLKGAFLLENIYQNIALRPMTDLDLLIKQGDFSDADRILKRLGYSRQAGLSPQATILYTHQSAGNFSLDIHFHPVNSSWLLKIGNFGLEKLWLDLEPAAVTQEGVLSFKPEQVLIQLSQNAFTHYFKKNILLIDFYMALKRYQGRIDWALALKEAEEDKLLNVLYFTIFLLQRQFKFNLPGIPAKLSPDSFGFKYKLAFLIQQNMHFYGIDCLIYFIIMPGFLNRLKFLGRVAPALPRFILKSRI